VRDLCTLQLIDDLICLVLSVDISDDQAVLGGSVTLSMPAPSHFSSRAPGMVVAQETTLVSRNDGTKVNLDSVERDNMASKMHCLSELR
jgi:hypothetical protein